jgi:peptidyl-prolyl cis-trans isomerase C
MMQVSVNGTAIPEAVIAAEMQFHPATDMAAAWRGAAEALVIRQLLLQEAARQGLAEDDEEATIRALLAQEISVPEADEITLHRYWMANRARFRPPALYEAAHILFPAAPDDETARDTAKLAAERTIAELQAKPEQFGKLAAERSACPSKQSGGRLGQLSRGDLVPELETFIFGLEDGQLCPVPVATRYGLHVLRLDRRTRAEDPPFEAVAERVQRHLQGQSWQRAVSQYLRLLAGHAQIEGIDLDAAATPLVQ